MAQIAQSKFYLCTLCQKQTSFAYLEPWGLSKDSNKVPKAMVGTAFGNNPF